MFGCGASIYRALWLFVLRLSLLDQMENITLGTKRGCLRWTRFVNKLKMALYEFFVKTVDGKLPENKWGRLWWDFVIKVHGGSFMLLSISGQETIFLGWGDEAENFREKLEVGLFCAIFTTEILKNFQIFGISFRIFAIIFKIFRSLILPPRRQKSSLRGKLGSRADETLPLCMLLSYL